MAAVEPEREPLHHFIFFNLAPASLLFSLSLFRALRIASFPPLPPDTMVVRGAR